MKLHGPCLSSFRQWGGVRDPGKDQRGLDVPAPPASRSSPVQRPPSGPPTIRGTWVDGVGTRCLT